MSEHFLERQHIELRKDVRLNLTFQMSKKKIEWEKERQLLLQKIDQLEIQLSDFESRERRMLSTQTQLMATIGNPKEEKMYHQTQQLLQELTSQVEIIRQATMNEGMHSFNGDDKRSEQGKTASQRVTVSHVEAALSDRQSKRDSKYRSVGNSYGIRDIAQGEKCESGSLVVPQHHLAGGYRKGQFTNQPHLEPQTLSFGLELAAHRTASRTSGNKALGVDHLAKSPSDKYRSGGLGESVGVDQYQYKESNCDSQGTIVYKPSHSGKKPVNTHSMPIFQASKSNIRDCSAENDDEKDHRLSLLHMRQECLESSNTSEGQDDQLEVSDARTNNGMGRANDHRSYEQNHYQQSAVTLHYNPHHDTGKPKKSSQLNHLSSINVYHPSGSIAETGAMPQAEVVSIKGSSKAGKRISRNDTSQDPPTATNAARYYVKPSNPSSSGKKVSQAPNYKHQNSGRYPADSTPQHHQISHHRQKSSLNPSSAHFLSQEPYSQSGANRSQIIEYSDLRNPNGHSHQSPMTHHSPAGELSRATHNPFKDYSPDTQQESQPASKHPFSKRHPTDANHLKDSTDSAYLHSQYIECSPKTVDKYSGGGPVRVTASRDPQKFRTEARGHPREKQDSRSRIHSQLHHESQQSYELGSYAEQGALIQGYLQPGYPQSSYLGHCQSASQLVATRGSVEHLGHLLSQQPYLASCSHFSSVNEDRSRGRPTAKHNQSCYTGGSGAFCSTKSKKTKKSALLNSRLTETSSGLTRKDVLEVLKLHKSLQEKITYLEGNKPHKHKK